MVMAKLVWLAMARDQCIRQHDTSGIVRPLLRVWNKSGEGIKLEAVRLMKERGVSRLPRPRTISAS